MHLRPLRFRFGRLIADGTLSGVIVTALVLSLALLCVALGSGLSAPGPAGIEVDTRVSADSVTVGERFRVVHRIAYPDSIVLIPPGAFETGTCRVMSVKWTDEKARGEITKTATLDLITTDLERARVPSALFRFRTPAGDTLSVSSDSVGVAVRRLTDAASEPKPLKPQWEAPRSFAFLYAVAAALVVAAIALWLFRRWRKRKIAATPEPELPADVVALQRLSEIERMNLLEAGDIKKHYTLVIDVLRTYVEKRYRILAMDQTTDEILWSLRRSRVDIGDFEPVLREADLVKFAKYKPEMGVAKRLIDVVRGVVARTAVRPLAAADEGAPSVAEK